MVVCVCVCVCFRPIRATNVFSRRSTNDRLYIIGFFIMKFIFFQYDNPVYIVVDDVRSQQ